MSDTEVKNLPTRITDAIGSAEAPLTAPSLWALFQDTEKRTVEAAIALLLKDGCIKRVRGDRRRSSTFRLIRRYDDLSLS